MGIQTVSDHSCLLYGSEYLSSKILATGEIVLKGLKKLFCEKIGNHCFVTVLLQNISPYALGIGKAGKYLQRVVTIVRKSLRVRDVFDAHSPCVFCFVVS